MNVLQMIQGYKTYFVAMVVGVLLFGVWQHWWVVPTEVYAGLSALMMVFLRNGVKNDVAGISMPATGTQTTQGTQGTGTGRLVMALTTLGVAVMLAGCFSGCSTLAPGADPVEVRAEQTEGLFADSADLFLKLEYENIDYCRTNLPDVHKAAEFLRQPVTVGTNVWPRDIAMVQSFDATRRTYKANRTSENKASLVAGLSALEEALRQIQSQVAQLGGHAAVQAKSAALLNVGPRARTPAAPEFNPFTPRN